MIGLFIGIAGMVFILAAFVLDEFSRKFTSESVVGNILNIIGSGLLAYYAFTLRSWPFLILNLVWCVTAMVKLGKIVPIIRKLRK